MRKQFAALHTSLTPKLIVVGAKVLYPALAVCLRPLCGGLLLLLLLTTCNPQPQLSSPAVPFSISRLQHYAAYTDRIAELTADESLTNARRTDSLLYWSAGLQNFHEEAAIAYAREAVRLSTAHNFDRARAEALYQLAFLSSRQAVYAEGLERPLAHARISLRLFEGLQDWQGRVRALRLIGKIHYRHDGHDSSFVYFSRALQTLQAAPLTDTTRLRLEGEIYHGMADVYYDIDSLTTAEQHYFLALDRYHLTRAHPAAARLRLALANLYTVDGRFAAADSLYRQVIDYGARHRDNNLLATSYRSYGYLRRQQYKQSGSLDHFTGALRLIRTGLQYQQDNHYHSYRLLGQVFQARAARDAAFAAGVDSAIIYYRQAMESARSEGALSMFRSLSYDAANLCDWLSSQGRSCNGLLGSSPMRFFYDNYSGVVDTITHNLAVANQQLIDFETAREEARTRRQVRSQWLISGVGLLILALVFLLFLQQKEKKRLQARMEALRAQINPHFMSNSLNAIESLVNLNDRESASRYLIHFSRLTRRLLNGSRSVNVSLAHELDTLKHFLALEQLRFGNKLSYTIEVDDEINIRSVEVPSLILQPYVENAIWHGLKPKTEGGRVRIHAGRDGKWLVCTVEDNGVGRQRARELRASSVLGQHRSEGMKITSERLIMAGSRRRNRVVITDLTDADGRASGTRVVIRLPLKQQRKPQKTAAL